MKKPQIEVYHPAAKAARDAMYEARLKEAQSPSFRVCNASPKVPYQTPVWPSARASQADSIKSRGLV
jgi:hypothetical protein